MTVHVKGKKYLPDNGIVAYFCFPRLGIAVPLRPGDALIFNPKEDHAVSSRFENKTEIYTISFYLQTAVVGLNNIDLELKPHQKMILMKIDK
jgi:ectoine hydroxylase-related dioxygenase (phytanoyl-CoA dioxygenase family)